jgi:hypothetical protein
MPLRKELNDLSDEEMFLYLEGLKGFQNEDMAKPLSYYQIAGKSMSRMRCPKLHWVLFAYF